MLWQVLTSMRDLGRLQEIASILIRYGFGDMVRRMGMANALERGGRALHWNDADDYAHMPPPVRVRRALEDLGPTFVKLGQVLATRVDQLEPEWIAEFGKLQDGAPPEPWESVRAQLCEDLGAPPEEVFATFCTEPLAAASVAQVHRATLEDGTEVIVKVRRPNIRPKIEADLRWLAWLAEVAESESPDMRAFKPREVVRQFARSLRRELDLSVECRNAERIAANFVGYVDDDTPPAAPQPAGEAPESPPPIIVIPRVHWAWTGERVCVQDFVNGISGRQLASADASGLDRKVLARRGARAVLKMIVEDGLFHADPHNGNVFYLPGNRIAFIDFGMVGRLTESRREQLTRLLLGMVKRDPRKVVDVMLDWTGEGLVDEEGLVQDIQAFVDQYHGLSMKQLNLAVMLTDMVGILRHHQVALPADLTLLVKAFISLNGMGRELDPDFNMVQEALPVLERAMRQRYSPSALVKRGWQSISEAMSLATGLPEDLSRLLRAARRGKLEIHIDVTHLKRVGTQLESATNRLVVGIVVAALIIGSSIVMTVPGGPTLAGLPFFGVLGFAGAVLGSLWLLVSIARSSRDD